MECNCCARETDNEMVLEENDFGRLVWNVYCDSCTSICSGVTRGKIMVLKFTKDELMKMLLTYFTDEVESCPRNAEAFCDVLEKKFSINQPERLNETAVGYKT